MAQFNNSHPELKDGELFAINHNPNGSAMINFDNLPYETKRLGEVAYDDSGNVIPGLKPVFASRTEFENHLNRAKCEKAYLVETSNGAFRKGVPAEVLNLVFFKREDRTLRLCYHVRFKDGKEDYTPVCDTDNHKVITKEEAEQLLKNL